jgi:site-specific recombinase XerD
MRGAPARAIQELAEHKEPSMTQRYLHLSPAALDAAIRLLEQPHTGHYVADARQKCAEFGNWR